MTYNVNITPLLSPLVCVDQNDFISGKSTATNQLVFQKFILGVYASDSQFFVIYTDFSKEIDNVNHNTILYYAYKL